MLCVAGAFYRPRAAVSLGRHALEHEARFDVRVPVVAVLRLAALAEQRVGLVEEQHRTALLGCIEDTPQVFLVA
jgi:hypothetical protein